MHLSHCAMISYPCSASLGSAPTAFIRTPTTMSEWLQQGYWFTGPERQKWTWLKSRVSSEMLNKTQDTNYFITFLSDNTSYVYQCYVHKWWGCLVRNSVISAFHRVWTNSTWHTEYQDAMNTSRIFTHRVYCLYYFQAIAVCYTAIPSHPL
jgi:hypothetical protein